MHIKLHALEVTGVHTFPLRPLDSPLSPPDAPGKWVDLKLDYWILVVTYQVLGGLIKISSYPVNNAALNQEDVREVEV